MSQQEYGFEDVEDAGLSAEESAILEKLIRGKLSPDLKVDNIPRRKVQSPAPLSFSQQRLWVLDRLLPDNPFYNLPYAFQVNGTINISIFEQSLNEIIRRHESLRTIFAMQNEKPVQVILPELKIKPGNIDLRGLSGEKQEEETFRLFAREAGKPFDLEHGPLVRAVLIHLDKEEYALLFNMHHIIFDSLSMQVFIRELGALYTSFSAGKPSPLPEPSLQYADFALWQRQRQEEILRKQLSYWRELLSGELPILELPTDRQRPTIPTYRGDYQTFELSETITNKLTQLNRQEQCSMFMTLLATFNVLLYRYCGQEDILVGSPIANRNRTELENMIGFFVNTLVFRTDLSGNPTFRDLLARVRKIASGAYDNQDLPFEKLVEEFQPDRYMSHTPLFQVMFNYTAPEKTGQKMNSSSPGLNINKLPVHNKTSKFDLWLTLGPRENKLAGGIEYNTDIFTEATITRLIGHFQTLLEGIVLNPDQRVNDLPLLSGEEKTQILEQLNETGTLYDIKCLHHSFEEQVEKTPHQVALVGEGGKVRRVEGKKKMHLSYRELNEKCCQLAAQLLEKGVTPDTIVGIMVERSIEMVVGLMGILKAGGAYLPIDPEYPEDRINYMLKDSRAKIILTVQEITGLYSPPAFNNRPKGTSSFGIWNLEFGISPRQGGQLAYIIYTSGSTGKPKGVQVPHAGISNRLHWMQEVFRLTAEDRVLQKTPYTFDVSIWEFFWPLLNGTGLVIAKPGGHKDCAYLVKTIRQEKITTIHFVPSMLNAFIEEPGLDSLDSLKRVIASGETLSKDHVQGFYRSFPNGITNKPRLHNLYGPTEASVDVTYWPCEANDTHRSVPLGRPIANTRIYILDRSANPVPIGVHGELHISGIQLARGYLNRPELTGEKFKIINYKLKIKNGNGTFRANLNAFGEDEAHELHEKNNQKFLPGGPGGAVFSKSAPPGRRRRKLYKTGDLARWLPDGNIEFLGRLDFQVKVRGFRIELGEIESKLRDHPYLEDAVVLARSPGDNPAAGEKKLAAYVVLHQEYRELFKQSAQLILELRNFLRERLPEYMTPSYFVSLEKLPLTSNGKLDRKKLPYYETALTTGDPEKHAIKPKTSNERFFVGTWKQVLGLEQIGVNQSFFQLGGDSVEAVRMISRINQRGYRFTLQDLYKNQTIAELINAAGKKGEVKEPEAEAEPPVLEPDREELARKLPPGTEIEDIYPATPLQCHMAACLKQQSHRVIEQPIFIYQRRYQPTPKSPDISILKKAIKKLFETYPYLRTLLLWRDMKEPLQVVCKKVDMEPAFIYQDFSQYSVDEQERRFYQLMNQEWQRGFEPDKDIPFRLVLVKLGENLVRYFYTGDYSRLDGWDAIFNFRTILAAYEALEAGSEMKMDTDNLYPLYVNSLKKQDPQEIKEYWQSYFKGFSGPKSYVDRFPGNNPGQEKGFGQQQLYLSRETTAAIHRILQGERLVFSPAACALWAMVLSRYSNEKDVTYGILTTGRSTASAGIEHMRGHTINILPIRIKIPTDTLFLDWLKQLMEMQLEWVRHEYTPIDKIYEYLGLTPEQPLFDNFVVIQNLIRITAKKNPLYGPDSYYSLYHAKMEYPLRLDVDPTLNIGLVFHYYRQCISDVVVKGLQENMKILLESIANKPQQTIGELMQLINPENIRLEKEQIKPMVL